MKLHFLICTAAMCGMGMTAALTADAVRARSIRPLASSMKPQTPPAPQGATADDEKKKPKPPGGIGPKPGGTRRTTGTVTGVSPDSISITTNSGTTKMTFLIDEKTTVLMRGGATTMAAGKSTGSPSVTDFVKEGSKVQIEYATKGLNVRADRIVVVKGGS